MRNTDTLFKGVVRAYIQCITEGVFNSVVFITKHNHDLLGLAGGGMDEGETPQEAVQREILEETGIPVELAHISRETSWIDRVWSKEDVGEKILVKKHLLIVTVDTAWAKRHRYHPNLNPTRELPAGNEGEIAHFAELFEAPQLIMGQHFERRHREYLQRSNRQLLRRIETQQLILPR